MPGSPKFEIWRGDGHCLECEDTTADVFCEVCGEEYCSLCFQSLHRKGKRALHTKRSLKGGSGVKRKLSLSDLDQSEYSEDKRIRAPCPPTPPPLFPYEPGFIGPLEPPGSCRHVKPSTPEIHVDMDDERMETEIPAGEAPASILESNGHTNHEDHLEANGNGHLEQPVDSQQHPLERKAREAAGLRLAKLRKSAPFTPLRLNEEERKILQVLLSALNTCQYTDKVDVATYTGRGAIIDQQLRETWATLLGLAVAAGDAEQVFDDSTTSSNRMLGDNAIRSIHGYNICSHDFDVGPKGAEYINRACEIGRRYKMMNPDKMRTEYGTLINMLQDAAQQRCRGGRAGGVHIRSCSVETVHTALASLALTEFMWDLDVALATKTIVPWETDPEKALIVTETMKSEASQRVIQRFSGPNIPEERIKLILDSLADADAYTVMNTRQTQRMIQLLQENFHSEVPKRHPEFGDGPMCWLFGLEIASGKGGSRLSHDHDEQWHYVMQTYALWLEILGRFHEFWMAAEYDLLKEGPGAAPSLRNTGQGLNRVQDAAKIGILMATCQRNVCRRPYPVLGKFGDTVNVFPNRIICPPTNDYMNGNGESSHSTSSSNGHHNGHENGAHSSSHSNGEVHTHSNGEVHTNGGAHHTTNGENSMNISKSNNLNGKNTFKVPRQVAATAAYQQQQNKLKQSNNIPSITPTHTSSSMNGGGACAGPPPVVDTQTTAKIKITLKPIVPGISLGLGNGKNYNGFPSFKKPIAQATPPPVVVPTIPNPYSSMLPPIPSQSWVGSAVVHLGDNCVPNGLVFVDKYAQIPRLLGPFLDVCDYLDSLVPPTLDMLNVPDLASKLEPIPVTVSAKGFCSDERALRYVCRKFGSPQRAKLYIMKDFVRSGFNGSGGDNYYDAGSCIDGRLTSAWNLCSKIEKRSYYPIMMLSGFYGFDGSFSR